MQAKIIEVLDQGIRAHIRGKGDNETDMTVELYRLKNPQKETIFENCVADVNIPVGEVFTSPVLYRNPRRAMYLMFISTDSVMRT